MLQTTITLMWFQYYKAETFKVLIQTGAPVAICEIGAGTGQAFPWKFRDVTSTSGVKIL